MNNQLMLLELPALADFLANPLSAITAVLTSSLGIFGYIFVMFALITIVFSYTRNMFSVGIFIVMYGFIADFLYPPAFVIIINLLGIGLIFGGIFYKGVFNNE